MKVSKTYRGDHLKEQFPALNKRWFYKFEIVHILVSLAFIIYHFIIMALLDADGILVYKLAKDTNNIAWTFTQFTWWTNISITFLQIIRLYLRHKKLNVRFIRFLFGKTWYINWVSYISLVGILFFSGELYIILRGEHIKMIHNLQGQIVATGVTPNSFLTISNLIITVFVHLVNPLSYLVLFFILIFKNYLVFPIKELTYHKIATNSLIGLIYPLIYAVFYITFSLIAYDPYPVSNLKSNEGWWLVPLIPIVFYLMIFLFWMLIRNRSLKWVSSKGK